MFVHIVMWLVGYSYVFIASIHRVHSHTIHGCRSAECKAHGNLGLVYELLKNTDKAIDHYEQVSVLALCVG